jgi:hypothetical protein
MGGGHQGGEHSNRLTAQRLRENAQAWFLPAIRFVVEEATEGARKLMTVGDLVGWVAAALTLLTFSMRSMMALRMAAVSANLCFLVYGGLSELYPVVALHVLLLPCNLLRLCQLRGSSDDRQRPRSHRRALNSTTEEITS